MKLKASVDDMFDDFWRPCMILLKEGVLSYKDINSIDADELFILYYANSLLNKEVGEVLDE